MKTTLLSLIAWLCIALTLNAQPVLNSCGRNPYPGDFYKGMKYYCDNTTAVPGSGGANLTWDFSTLIATDTVPFLDTFVNYHENPMYYLQSGTIATYNGRYDVYEYHWNEIEYKGWCINTSNCYIHASRAYIIKCPFSYEQSFFTEYPTNTCDLHQYTNSRFSAYDAYGTLTLPGGHTYTDIIRLHTVDTLIENAVEIYRDVYVWYDQTVNRSRLTMSRQWGNGSSGALVIDYDEISDFFVGTAEPTLMDAIKVYPNPAANQLHIEVPNEIPAARFKVISLSGQQLMELPLTLSHTTLETSSLPAGMYLYQLQDKKGNVLKSGKLAKE